MHGFDKAFDVFMLCREYDHFLPRVSPLPHFAGRQVAHERCFGFERENVFCFELNRCFQLRRGHERKAKILHVHDSARERRDDVATDKRLMPQHLTNHVSRPGHQKLRLGAQLFGNCLLRGRNHFQLIADNLELQQFDGVVPDVDADRLRLCACESEHKSLIGRSLLQ
jgi:hypothetical protein